jgi:phage FluMu protein Com
VGKKKIRLFRYSYSFVPSRIYDRVQNEGAIFVTEVKCPKCGEVINHLVAFSLEENMQDVRLVDEESDWLDWDVSEPVELSCQKIDFTCPFCRAILFTNKGDDCDKRVIEFLKGEDGKPEKVEFT